jgi:hypothetical protein
MIRPKAPHRNRDPRHRAALDAANRAMRTQDPLADGEALDRMTRALDADLRGPLDAIADDVGIPDERDIRDHLLGAVVSQVLGHAPHAMREAIADVAAPIPPPMPFSPPAAGAWIRTRSVGWDRRPEPTWVGMWHVFSGDWKVDDPRTRSVTGRARCWANVRLRAEPMFAGGGRYEAVVADQPPSTQTCGRCSRITASPTD